MSTVTLDTIYGKGFLSSDMGSLTRVRLLALPPVLMHWGYFYMWVPAGGPFFRFRGLAGVGLLSWRRRKKGVGGPNEKSGLCGSEIELLAAQRRRAKQGGCPPVGVQPRPFLPLVMPSA